jgi:hypothetical protein
MKMRIAIGLIIAVGPASLAFAEYPKHADICVYEKLYNGQTVFVVSKEKLAKSILKKNDDWMKLYVDAKDQASNPDFAPQWRRIFVDPDFCVNDPGCLGPPLKPADDAPKPPKPVTPGVKPPPDYSAADANLDQLRQEFVRSVATYVDGTYYTSKNSQITTQYLIGDNTKDRITCTPSEVPAVADPVAIKMPKELRLRANSDDLSIDASKQSQQTAFKAAKPATISFSRDGVQKSNTTKAQAAFGYAIPLFTKPDPSGYFTGELVPYISAIQSVTKVDGKPSTSSDTNNVAVGALLNSRALFNGTGLDNGFTAKPQYFWNTKDKSEIASLRLIYQPFTDGDFRINVPIQLGNYPEASWLTILFDLRNDTGNYTKAGIDPKTAVNHISFDRAGSKFGFAMSTPETGAHLVLNVTETMLYGFTGSVRQLSYFDSNLTLYFDKTTNYGFTISYSKGQNEDTAEWSQAFMASLSVKF